MRRESVHKPKEVKCVKVVEVEEGGGQLMQEMDVQHFALKRYVEFLGSVGRPTCSVMRTVTPKPSTASTLVHSSEEVAFLLAARCCRRLSADIL